MSDETKDEVVELPEKEVHDLKHKIGDMERDHAAEIAALKAKHKGERETLVKQMATIQEETKGIALGLKELNNRLLKADSLLPASAVVALLKFEGRLEALLK